MRAFRGFSISILVGLVLGPVVGGTTLQAADTDADTAAIEELTQQAVQAFVARDWEGFARIFTDNAV